MAEKRAKRVEELVERHGRMVFATAYRILGVAEDAEDVLQDVFMKVLGNWRSRPNLDAVRDWGAWLRVAATRRAVDVLRRNRKREYSVGDNIELTPENVVEHRGLLRWTFISLAWGGALGDHLSKAQELNGQADAAQSVGDTETLKATLSKLAKMAASLLVEHRFVTEDGQPVAYLE